jgi:dihydroorotate dehydrogenase (NAD+) catalytic subunit
LGGIETAEDVLEYFVVGASAVQVGTASFADPNACARIISELEKLCASYNIPNINGLLGTFRAENH